METRHAAGVALTLTGGSERAEETARGPWLKTGGEARPENREGAERHGRESASRPSPADAGDAQDRARSVLRLDRRAPQLRLVGGEGVHPGAGGGAGADAALGTALAVLVGADRYARVFDGQVMLEVEGGAVVVRAASRAAAGAIERRFGGAIRQAAEQVLGAGVAVRFEFDEAAAPGAPAATSPAPSLGAGAAKRVQRRTDDAGSGSYRLDDFVVGPSNRLAYNAAVQAAGSVPEGAGEGDAETRLRGVGAPLLIHGPCGVGKTHLLRGIAARFREKHPGAVVRVITGEMFLNEFVAAFRHGGGSAMTGQSRSSGGSGGIERFRRQYRRCDLLCIDDVHFLARKEATQQELLHTFDQLMEGGRGGTRIVLASDRHPRELCGRAGEFSPALVSRFLSGMVAGIDPPDATVREQALRVFAARRGLVLEEAALRLLVDHTSRSGQGGAAATVRDLEGLVTRVEAVHRLEPCESARVGVISVQRALAGSVASRASMAVRRPIKAETIIARTCVALGVDRSDLGAPTRHKRVVLARAVITHLCREFTTLSYPEIARAIGRPSHSTVITAHQRLARQIEAGEVWGIGAGGEAVTVSGLVEELRAAVGGA